MTTKIILMKIFLTCLEVTEVRSITLADKQLTLTMYDYQVSWNRAQATCVSNGGILYKEDSPERSIVLASFRASWPYKHLWIGLHYPSTETNDEFGWLDCYGQNLAEYNNWDLSHPQSPNRCAFTDRGTAMWESKPCEQGLRFVCQNEGGQCDFTSRTGIPEPSSDFEALTAIIATSDGCQHRCLVHIYNFKNCWAVIYEEDRTCTLYYTDNPFLFETHPLAASSNHFHVKQCYFSNSIITTEDNSINAVDSPTPETPCTIFESQTTQSTISSTTTSTTGLTSTPTTFASSTSSNIPSTSSNFQPTTTSATGLTILPTTLAPPTSSYTPSTTSISRTTTSTAWLTSISTTLAPPTSSNTPSTTSVARTRSANSQTTSGYLSPTPNTTQTTRTSETSNSPTATGNPTSSNSSISKTTSTTSLPTTTSPPTSHATTSIRYSSPTTRSIISTTTGRPTPKSNASASTTNTVQEATRTTGKIANASASTTTVSSTTNTPVLLSLTSNGSATKSPTTTNTSISTVMSTSSASSNSSSITNTTLSTTSRGDLSKSEATTERTSSILTTPLNSNSNAMTLAKISNSTCLCRCSEMKNELSNLTLAQKLELIRLRLRVDYKTLSSRIRKKTCAKDDRVASQSVGYAAIIFTCIEISLIIAGDFMTIFKYFRHMFNPLKVSNRTAALT